MQREEMVVKTDMNQQFYQDVVKGLQLRHVNISPGRLASFVEANLDLESQLVESYVNVIYSMLLLSDLQNVGTNCLPFDLSHSVKTFITGHFFLQVNIVLDVSKPAYQQLKSIMGANDSNAHVNADQPDQTVESVTGTRTLMLSLTDGAQDVNGIEWKSIPSLNSIMQPGTKILVYGHVECRRGLLLLNKENTRVLGGSVMEFVPENSARSVLCRRLGLPCDENCTELIRNEDAFSAGGERDKPLFSSREEEEEFWVLYEEHLLHVSDVKLSKQGNCEGVSFINYTGIETYSKYGPSL